MIGEGIMEIIPGIHQLQLPIPDNPLGYLNAYLMEGDRGWVMVDTGWDCPEAREALYEQLRAMGIALADIADVVVTHAHPDHFGLAAMIKEASNARLYLHRLESMSLQSWRGGARHHARHATAQLRLGGMPENEIDLFARNISGPDKTRPIARPDAILQGGEKIPLRGATLEVIWTPGHAPGHICLYDRERKLFFSGDHILPVITPNVSQFNPRLGTNPLREYLDSLKAVEPLQAAAVLPAHEHVFHDLQKRVGELLLHHEHRLEAILEVSRDRAKTAYEVASGIPWMPQMVNGEETGGVRFEVLPLLHRALAMGETSVHLELLTKQRRVSRSYDGKRVVYRCNGR